MKTLDNLNNCQEHLEMAIKIQQNGTIRDKGKSSIGGKLNKSENAKLFNSLMALRDHLELATNRIKQL